MSPLAFPKSGVTPKQERKRKRRRQLAEEAAIKAMVRIRDSQRCRICRRPAESVHEIKPKSVGGTVSLENSIAVCGDGVRGCHGFAQRHEINFRRYDDEPIDANDGLYVHTLTRAATRWLEDGLLR